MPNTSTPPRRATAGGVAAGCVAAGDRRLRPRSISPVLLLAALVASVPALLLQPRTSAALRADASADVSTTWLQRELDANGATLFGSTVGSVERRVAGSGDDTRPPVTVDAPSAPSSRDDEPGTSDASSADGDAAPDATMDDVPTTASAPPTTGARDPEPDDEFGSPLDLGSATGGTSDAGPTVVTLGLMGVLGIAAVAITRRRRATTT